MHILHFSPHLAPGGTAQMAADFACALQRTEQCTNTVLSPANELVSRIRLCGAEHRICRKPSLFNAFAEMQRLRRIIRKESPHILQVYSPQAAAIAWWGCRKLPAHHKPLCVGVLSAFPQSGFITGFWKKCDYFVTISKHLRQHLLKGLLSTRRKNLLLIPYGVNQNQCFPQFCVSADHREQWICAHPEAKNSLTLCIPGAITPLHGLQDLAPILSGLLRMGIPTHAFIAGDSRKADPAFAEELKKRFAEADLSEHISWIGARPDLREVMCECDVTLCLAHSPATHNHTILEALALGRPVAAYDHGAVGELLEAFLPEGRVAPQDTTAMVDTLSQWHTYRPSTISAIPYPYRLADSADSLLRLYSSITGHE